MNYPTDAKGRYLRIPTPLKREEQPTHSLQERINWVERHKRFIVWYQRKLGLSDYGLLWFVFFKGIIVAVIIDKAIFS